MKFTAAVKEVILEAFHDLGGKAFLVEQAKEHPQAFMQLLARLIPLDVSANIHHRVDLVENSERITRALYGTDTPAQPPAEPTH